MTMTTTTMNKVLTGCCLALFGFAAGCGPEFAPPAGAAEAAIKIAPTAAVAPAVGGPAASDTVIVAPVDGDDVPGTLDANLPGGGGCNGVVDCDDGNPCTVDSCQRASGLCKHTVARQGTLCRAAADVCDRAEYCNGTTTVCPADRMAREGVVCRASTAECDPAEACTGSTAECPDDTYLCAYDPNQE